MRFLLGEVVGGRLPEGAFLPRIVDLTAQFGVSAGVIRECLMALQERGVVTITHGRGTRVNGPERWNRLDPDVLAAILAGEGGGAALSQYLECRRIFEVEAAGLAAERATAQDMALLARLFECMKESAERALRNPAAEDRYREEDIEFHRAVVEATGNSALARMTEPINRALATAIEALARPRLRVERGLPEHERILKAIARGSSEEARAAMGDHLATIEGYLAESLGAGSALAVLD